MYKLIQNRESRSGASTSKTTFQNNKIPIKQIIASWENRV